MHCVEALRALLGQLHLLHGNDREAVLFNTSNDLAGHLLGDGVGLNDGEGALYGHDSFSCFGPSAAPLGDRVTLRPMTQSGVGSVQGWIRGRGDSLGRLGWAQDGVRASAAAERSGDSARNV